MTETEPQRMTIEQTPFQDVVIEVRLAPGTGWADLREWINEHPKFLFWRFIEGKDAA